MKSRLIIEFPSEVNLAVWVEDLKQLQSAKLAVYKADGLDNINPENTYILRREGDRPEEFRLRITTTETTERVV